MKEAIYHEERHLPILICWPLIALGDATLVTNLQDQAKTMPQALFYGYAAIFFLLGIAVCEFITPVLDVRDQEVRWSFTPLWRRSVWLEDVITWRIMTYQPINHAEQGHYLPIGYRGMGPQAVTYVEFHMKNGSVISVISQHPGRLSAAVGIAKSSRGRTLPSKAVA